MSRPIAARSPAAVLPRFVALRSLEEARRCCGIEGPAFGRLGVDRQLRAAAALDRAIERLAPLPWRSWRRLRRRVPAAPEDATRVRLEGCLVAAADAIVCLWPRRLAERVGIDLLEVSAALDPACLFDGPQRGTDREMIRRPGDARCRDTISTSS